MQLGFQATRLTRDEIAEHRNDLHEILKEVAPEEGALDKPS